MSVTLLQDTVGQKGSQTTLNPNERKQHKQTEKFKFHYGQDPNQRPDDTGSQSVAPPPQPLDF